MSEVTKVETLMVTVYATPEAILSGASARDILDVKMDEALKTHAAVEVGDRRLVEWHVHEIQPRDRPAEVPSDAMRVTMTARVVRRGTA